MNAEFSMVLPSPVMSRAPSKTVTRVWPFTSEEIATANNRPATNSQDNIFFARYMELSFRARLQINIFSPQTVSEVRSSPSLILPARGGGKRWGSETFVVRVELFVVSPFW